MRIIKKILRPFWLPVKFCLLKSGLSPEKISDGKLAVLDFLVSLLPVGLLRRTASRGTVERAGSLSDRQDHYLKLLNREWDAQHENRN